MDAPGNFAHMVSQCFGNALAQLGGGEFFGAREDQRAVGLVAEFWAEALAEGFNQGGLAMKVDCVASRFCADGVYPDCAAALAFAGEVARLAPFQRFLQLADLGNSFRGGEDQVAHREQLFPNVFRVGGKDFGYGEFTEGFHAR